MVQDQHVVQIIHLFILIKPWPIGDIVLRFVNLDENPIKKINTTLELKYVHAKGSPLLNSKPLNLTTYGLVNAKCNENHIITYCILITISLKKSYMITLSCFMYRMNQNNNCFGLKLIG